MLSLCLSCGNVSRLITWALPVNAIVRGFQMGILRGSVIGATLGGILLGPLGLAIGAAVGAMADDAPDSSSPSNSPSNEDYKTSVSDDGDTWARDCGYRDFEDYSDTHDFDD